MRTLLIFIFLVLFYIVSLPLYVILYFVGKKNPHKRMAISQAIVSRAFRCILFLSGTKLIIKGLDNVPKDEAFLYVSNHRSYFDIVVTYGTVPTLTGFVAKKEMTHIPLISRWMRYLNCLFLDRKNIRKGLKTILKGIDNMKNGYSMYIAPEGTRNHEAEMLPFKGGSFKLAEKSGCGIIPIALTNTDAVFELHSPWVRKATVVIEYGKPIYMNDLEKEQKKHIETYVQNEIRTMLKANENCIK